MWRALGYPVECEVDKVGGWPSDDVRDNLVVDEGKSMIYPLIWLTLDPPEWNESLESEDPPLAHAKPRPQTLKTGYLVTPKRIQKQKAVNPPGTPPSPSSPCVSSRQHEADITLTEAFNARFFRDLVQLLTYFDTQSQTIDFENLNKKIRLYASCNVYPEVDWLSGLVQSGKEKDVMVYFLLYRFDKVTEPPI